MRANLAVSVLVGLGLMASAMLSHAGAPATAGIDESYFQNFVWRLDNYIDYTMTPPAWLTPPDLGTGRTPTQAAKAFLQHNQEALAIQQPLMDFSFVEELDEGSGSYRVTYTQGYKDDPVDTSYIHLQVRADIVTKVEAHFVSDVTTLRDCVTSLDDRMAVVAKLSGVLGYESSGAEVDVSEPFFTSIGTETVQAFIVTWDVSNDLRASVVDACNAEILDGWTEFDLR